MRVSNTLSRYASAVLVFSGALLLWEGLVRGGFVPAYLLPAPSQAAVVAVLRFPDILPHLLLTLRAVGYGFISALAGAVVLASLMHHVRLIRNIFYPLLVFSQTVPLIVLAPLFILWFGFGLLPKALIVVLVCFFPLAINTLEGLDGTDRDQVELLRTMGAGPLQILLYVKLPGALGQLFSGLKIAATYSVIGAVIGEWLGGTEGLGVYMVRAQKAFAIERVFAAVIYVTLISLILLGLIKALQKAVMPWRRV